MISFELVSTCTLLLLADFAKSAQDCTTELECAGSTFSGNEEIRCHAYKSCIGADIYSGSELTMCHGSYSCYESSLLSSTDIVECFGLMSCAKSNIIANDIDCYGELSCFQTNISSFNNDNTLEIVCGGDHACYNSTIINATIVNSYGRLSLRNSTIISGINHMNIYIYGFYSGLNSTVICENGNNCTIYCRNTGCNGMLFTALICV